MPDRKTSEKKRKEKGDGRNMLIEKMSRQMLQAENKADMITRHKQDAKQGEKLIIV